MDKEYSKDFISSPNPLEKESFHPSKTGEAIARSKEAQKEMTVSILESSKRSLRLLRETEDIAVSTSRELHCQSEQLVTTEKNLNSLCNTVKINNQQINKIKSPFGFLKNFMESKKESLFGWKNKKQVDFKHPNTSKSSPPHRPNPQVTSKDVGLEVSNNLGELQKKSSIPKGLQKLLDDDLDEISCSLARLKTLSLEMGNEVDMQNEHLDHIVNKAETVSTILQKQNKVVKELIG